MGRSSKSAKEHRRSDRKDFKPHRITKRQGKLRVSITVAKKARIDDVPSATNVLVLGTAYEKKWGTHMLAVQLAKSMRVPDAYTCLEPRGRAFINISAAELSDRLVKLAKVAVPGYTLKIRIEKVSKIRISQEARDKLAKHYEESASEGSDESSDEDSSDESDSQSGEESDSSASHEKKKAPKAKAPKATTKLSKQRVVEDSSDYSDDSVAVKRESDEEDEVEEVSTPPAKKSKAATTPRTEAGPSGVAPDDKPAADVRRGGRKRKAPVRADAE
jgi:hypothetical protein